ncbi:thymidine phosphorylase family protein [Phenylobacterium kunshanense]|uniref:Putative thymidine phosphorylase n=1 Tax=Phenylobacterium kunshanense TaxID=1445034 RepID=A0A328B7G3_9CAUL|nr:thymidine phosphorylase family protein [Phenylobacterium kunshanense]RAK62351.1 thymidine phosphorylase [Phenylobacterium kunshanense]
MDGDSSSAGQRPTIAPATLVARPLALDTFRENVVLLARNNPVVRPERLAGVRKVEVVAGSLRLLAVPMICDDPSVVGPGEIGLPQPVFRRLGVTSGDAIHVAPARAPKTLDLVKAKIAGESLTDDDYRAITRDLAGHQWSDMEVAAFLVACAAFMTTEETLALTRAMIGAGARLDWGRPMVVDKHCIGGIPGNRTSLIVTPIVAAHGLTMPKTSSRAITSPAGTADTMEVFARVDLNEAEMRSVVEACGACVVWGGRVNLSPADDVLISVERPLSIDTPEQMVASILSKKTAAGSTHLILDVPVGPTAKVRDRRSALRLKKLFEYVADGIGLSLEVMITEAPEPIGRGVGPVLEARDVEAVLAGRADAPSDLKEKAVWLAGRVLEFDPALHGGAGERRARDLLESGAAMAKMEEICAAQGASPIARRTGALTHEVCAATDGHVASIDCLRIASVARLAGAPTDPGAGLELLRKMGEPVRAGEPVYRIHASEPADFGFAIEAAGEDSGVRISR